MLNGSIVILRVGFVTRLGEGTKANAEVVRESLKNNRLGWVYRRLEEINEAQ